MASTQTLEVPGYQVVEFLGSGARSTIWRIRERQSNKLFALKRVVKRANADMRFLEQALNEYEVATQLDHPVIRRMFRCRRIKRWLSLREVHLVMELCEGKTIQEDRPTSILATLHIFDEVARALAAMNGVGFVHADIKPNNIIVAPDGQVRVIDLGQSCRLGTVKERIQGTPDFIAPEQVHRRPLDARTDVFNFGAALYWTLTGQPIPTILPKNESTIMRVKDLSVKPVEQVNPKVPPPLSKLVKECIEMSPSRRPRTMGEVQARIDLIVTQQTRNGYRQQD